ncbi:MAG: thermonuclease family protein [Nitrospiraceae bacterium]|nr:thermonuclease family protein [Nitrospiraceae bacterium]
MSKRLTKILLVAVLSGLSLLMGLVVDKEGSSAAIAADVVRVIDGDSIVVSMSGQAEEIRLIGIDAPEMGQRPWGRKAREHLKEILLRSSYRVSVAYDVEKRDKYGRLLAYIRTADGGLANAEMLKGGDAVLFTVPPNIRHLRVFREAQEYARKRRLGIWGKWGLREAPNHYRRQHPRR